MFSLSAQLSWDLYLLVLALFCIILGAVSWLIFNLFIESGDLSFLFDYFSSRRSGIWILVFFLRRNLFVRSDSYKCILTEFLWTLCPTFILFFMFGPSVSTVYAEDVHSLYNSSLVTLKVTGFQWFWNYTYPDYVFNDDFLLTFDSCIVDVYSEDSPSTPGKMRPYGGVDNRIVLPVGLSIRALGTSSDVIHSWAVPNLDIRIDAIPGRVDETVFVITKPGLFYGQCSELCGSGHGFMPIAVQGCSLIDYYCWINFKLSEQLNELYSDNFFTDLQKRLLVVTDPNYYVNSFWNNFWNNYFILSSDPNEFYFVNDELFFYTLFGDYDFTFWNLLYSSVLYDYNDYSSYTSMSILSSLKGWWGGIVSSFGDDCIPPVSGGPLVHIDVISREGSWVYKYYVGGLNFELTPKRLHPCNVTGPLGSPVPLHLDGNVDVDGVLLLPINSKVSLCMQPSNEGHTLSIPDLGVLLIQNSTEPSTCTVESVKTGLFYGFCSEGCEESHPYMPSVVEFASNDRFKDWLAITYITFLSNSPNLSTSDVKSLFSDNFPYSWDNNDFFRWSDLSAPRGKSLRGLIYDIELFRRRNEISNRRFGDNSINFDSVSTELSGDLSDTSSHVSSGSSDSGPLPFGPEPVFDDIDDLSSGSSDSGPLPFGPEPVFDDIDDLSSELSCDSTTSLSDEELGPSSEVYSSGSSCLDDISRVSVEASSDRPSSVNRCWTRLDGRWVPTYSAPISSVSIPDLISVIDKASDEMYSDSASEVSSSGSSRLKYTNKVPVEDSIYFQESSDFFPDMESKSDCDSVRNADIAKRTDRYASSNYNKKTPADLEKEQRIRKEAAQIAKWAAYEANLKAKRKPPE